MVHIDSVPLSFESYAIFALITILLWWNFKRKTSLPPGPFGVPFLGYIPFMGHKPQDALERLRKKYGPIYSLPLGSNRYVILNEFDTIYEALVKKGNALSGKSPSTFIRWFGGDKGYVWRTYSNDYRNLRKFGLTALRGIGVGKRSMEDRINEEVRYLSEVIMAKHGKPFDVTNCFGNATISILWNIISGKRIDYENEKFKKMLDMTAKRFGENSKRLRAISLLPVLRFLPGYSTVLQETVEQVHFTSGVIAEAIENHIKSFDSNDIRDFIDAFIRQMGEKEKQPFTTEVLNPIIRDFLVGGSETVSATLRWCILYLAEHRDYQQRLQEEIKEECGTNVNISMGNRSNMHLMCSFIHEIQRYNPTAVLLPRKTTEKLSLGGHTFPKNTLIMINLWAVHHNKKVFDNPEEFRPKRFLNDDGKFSKHNHVIPFSLGPRNCMGLHLAEMELFLILSGLLRNFEVTKHPEHPLPSISEGHHGVFYHPLPYKVCFVAR